MGNNRKEILDMLNDIEEESILHENPTRMKNEQQSEQETQENDSVETQLADYMRGLYEDGVSFEDMAKKIISFVRINSSDKK